MNIVEFFLIKNYIDLFIFFVVCLFLSNESSFEDVELYLQANAIRFLKKVDVCADGEVC